MQDTTAAELAAPQTDVVEYTAAEIATFRRAKAVWQQSDWANARGVLLYTSCMTMLTSHTLNANVTAHPPAASFADLCFRQNRRLYGSMGRRCSLATVMLLITSQLFGCFGSHTGFDVLDFTTTGLGWQVIMAVTYFVQAVAAVVISKDSDDVSASSHNSPSSGHLVAAEKLAAPLIDDMKVSNSTFWWHQICFCLLFWPCSICSYLGGFT